MIATIIMVIIFLGFAAMITYNVMSFNHNISISNEINIMDNELKIIKQKLIADAKPIAGSGEYSLPYGTTSVTNHNLPTHLSLAQANVKGYDFLYCPYGVVDSTIKDKTVNQNDGGSYNVKNIEVNGVEYTAYSDAPVSFSGSPEVSAFIISKFEDINFNCSDILYDNNAATYYSTDVKVVTITKDEINDYFKLNDLSGVTEELIVNNLNITETLSVLENDESNKSYEITLSENIALDRNFNIKKDLNKKNTIHFELGDYYLIGDYTFSVDNVNLSIHGNNNSTPSETLTSFEIINSSIGIDNATIGGLKLVNSKATLNNFHTHSSSSQETFNAVGSKIFTSGFSDISKNSIGSHDIVTLKDSQFTNESGVLTIRGKNGTPSYGISLYNSYFSNYGTLDFSYTGSIPTNDIFIGNTSVAYINGGSINLSGKNSDSGIFVSGGTLSSEGTVSNINIKTSTVNHIIAIEGGSMIVDSLNVGANGNRSQNETISEEIFLNNEVGINLIKGDNVNIYGDINACWVGETFKNKDGTVKLDLTNSGSNRTNNISNWDCLQ